MDKNFKIDLKTVGGRIRIARHRLGLTQEKAAEQTELTGQYWSLLETGRERGSINTYMQMAAALNLTLDDLFYDNPESLNVRKSLEKNGYLEGYSDSEKAIISETIHALKRVLERVRRL